MSNTDLSSFNLEYGQYFHGSKVNTDKLLSSAQSGNIRFGEEERRGFRNVVFLTKDIDEAIRYAGKEGIVYIVNAYAIKYKNAVAQIINPKKLKSVNENIYVAPPDQLKIVAKWYKLPRKKGEKQKYETEYIGEHSDL